MTTKILSAENLTRSSQRPPVDEKKLKAFLEAGEAPAPRRELAHVPENEVNEPTPPTSRPKRSKASRLRRPESGTRVAVYLPDVMEAELRMFCARERRSMSDAVSEAVRHYLKRHSPKDP